MESFTDDELTAIRHFGTLQSDPYTVTFRATPEQRRQAERILRDRKAAAPDEVEGASDR